MVSMFGILDIEHDVNRRQKCQRNCQLKHFPNITWCGLVGENADNSTKIEISHAGNLYKDFFLYKRWKSNENTTH